MEEFLKSFDDFIEENYYISPTDFKKKFGTEVGKARIISYNKSYLSRHIFGDELVSDYFKKRYPTLSRKSADLLQYKNILVGSIKPKRVKKLPGFTLYDPDDKNPSKFLNVESTQKDIVYEMQIPDVPIHIKDEEYEGVSIYYGWIFFDLGNTVDDGNFYIVSVHCKLKNGIMGPPCFAFNMEENKMYEIVNDLLDGVSSVRNGTAKYFDPIKETKNQLVTENLK